MSCTKNILECPWLSPTAKEILERYPDVKGGRLLPFICEQDYNRAIKKMIRLAGIDRIVTTVNTIMCEEEKHPIWEVLLTYGPLGTSRSL